MAADGLVKPKAFVVLRGEASAEELMAFVASRVSPHKKVRRVEFIDHAIQVLSEEVAAGRRYDLVLVDPPYRLFSDVQTGLATYIPRVLADDGLAVIETHAKEEPELPLEQRTSRRYGSARLTLFEHP